MYCTYSNQDIFLHLFPRYGPMGLRKIQECNKIKRIGSKRPIKVGLVERSATNFLAPWMIGSLTEESVTKETKRIVDKACNY